MKRTGVRRMLALSAAAALLLTACGRNMPQPDEQQLAAKHSLLVLAAPSVGEADAAKLKAELVRARGTDHMAFEWQANVAAIDNAAIARIKSISYDRIVVIGSELIEGGVAAAKQTPQRNWTFFANTTADPSASVANEANVALYITDPAAQDRMWNDWVAEQTAAGRTFEWISDTAHPVPASWAPSEEADHIVMLDIFGTYWFNQLTAQSAQHRPSWLVTLVPLQPADETKLQSLRIPVMNMAQDARLVFDWVNVLKSQLQEIKDDRWKQGVTVYGPDMLAVGHK
ncbi:hypothetical protein [Paenibacillus cymbidii]|uniref:hypothetical protein n=1 Tax=Paenibacillus cymbidii TaxID=1639034 RepID=UPI0010820367|nr:hypothetical protein [Paenibacillus cymbidii]